MLLSFVKQPWFDFESPHDKKVLFFAADEAVDACEVETLDQAERAQASEHAPHNRIQIVQYRGRVDPNDGAMIWLLETKPAAALGRMLGAGPAERVALVLGRPSKGALRSFADAF